MMVFFIWCLLLYNGYHIVYQYAMLEIHTFLWIFLDFFWLSKDLIVDISYHYLSPNKVACQDHSRRRWGFAANE